MFYYVVPVIIEYVKDENGVPTEVIQSVSPSVVPSSKWVADCRDGVNYLIKTDVAISNLQAITDEDFDAVVTSIGFNPAQVRNWAF